MQSDLIFAWLKSTAWLARGWELSGDSGLPLKLGQRWLSKNKMAEGSLQFSGGEKEVIERKLDVSTDALDTRKDISDFYEISRCVDVIKRRGFEKVNSNFHNSTISSTGIIKTLQDKKKHHSLISIYMFPNCKFSSFVLPFCQQLVRVGPFHFYYPLPPPPYCILATGKSLSAPLIFFNKLWKGKCISTSIFLFLGDKKLTFLRV